MKKKTNPKGPPANETDEYISNAPQSVQAKLKKIRAAVKAAAPGATERTDYFQFPGYSYEGAYDYSGMFAWFSYKKPHIRVHVRPPVAAKHKRELAGCAISVGAVGFPEDAPISTALVKKLVKASIKVMKDKARKAKR